MNERRSAIRWDIVLLVRYMGMSRHAEGSCRTQDLSTQGAKLEMMEKHSAGDRLNLMLEVNGNGKEQVCIEADVVWQTEPIELNQGCNYMTGVIFRKIRDCHKKSILDHVNVNHPQQFRQRWWSGI